ncbi:MAG: hypothetical protein HYY16_04550 [Planctomycetes bacterium]|nr:hypothetical protein [Planctomycetota bacterium]
MRRSGLLVVVLLGACHTMTLEEHELASRGLTQEDLEAPPSDNDIRARIMTDVRTTWLPEAQLDQGLRECPVVRFEEGRPVCAADGTEMKMFTLRNDSPDRQHPVRETAYFCPTESAYWYHYEGGDARRDVWFGPRRVKMRPGRQDH